MKPPTRTCSVPGLSVSERFVTCAQLPEETEQNVGCSLWAQVLVTLLISD